MPSPQKIALLDRLVAERHISAQQRREVLAYAQVEEARIEDALIETSVLDEAILLKWLAGFYKTHFVSTEKLAKSEVDRATLSLIPRLVAERLCVFPVLFSAKDNSLAFVLADPENSEIAKEVCLAARVPNVKPLVARPAAVRAAIQKYYAGDIHAFGKLDQRSVQQFHQMLDTYERNVFDHETLAPHPVSSTTPGPRAPEPQQALVKAGLAPPGAPRAMRKIGENRPSPPPVPAFAGERNTEETLALSDAASASLLSVPLGTSYAASIELINVLVTLLENPRQELRGHSAQVARLMQRVGEHMSLDASELYALRLTGLLHDVGKVSSYHLTALNVAEYEGHRVQARKSYLSPVRLFDAAMLPKSCIEGLSHVYERFDGQGFPDRRAGKDIPLAARLLAIVETYADLTSNERNPFRKTLTPKGAVEVLKRYRDSIFDGNLVDLFQVAALGEDIQSKLLNERPRILLVDADAEETTVLELRLVEQGHEVVLCRNAEQAYKLVQQGGLDALLCEVELKPHDGFSLVEAIRRLPHGEDLPVLFLTRRSDRASLDRGFALGAADYIVKPAAPDVVVAKARNVLAKGVQRRATRGVSGFLSEMPLPDVLQVLARTRKTGLLRISCDGYAGEIQFGNGAVYQASYRGFLGAEAVYAMLRLTEGEFTLDPSFVPASRAVHDSTEQLLLEGMRRLDESPSDSGSQHDFSTTRLDG